MRVGSLSCVVRRNPDEQTYHVTLFVSVLFFGEQLSFWWRVGVVPCQSCLPWMCSCCGCCVLTTVSISQPSLGKNESHYGGGLDWMRERGRSWRAGRMMMMTR